MPFLIQGSVKEVFESFGRKILIVAGEGQTQVDIDIHRAPFFGTPEQRQRHVAIWTDPELSPPDNYCQGHMFGGVVKMLFDDDSWALPTILFTQQELKTFNMEELHAKLSVSSFGYIDETGNARALLICYRKDDPTKWIIAHTENLNRPPSEAQVKILTSFDPRPLCRPNEITCRITGAVSNANAIIDSIGSERLRKFIGQILKPNNRIHQNANNIALFTQMVTSPDCLDRFLDNRALLDCFERRMDEVWTNPVFTKLRSFDPWLTLAPEQLVACFNSEADLYKRINQYELQGPNNLGDKQRLWAIIFLDRWQLNHRQEAIAADQEFVQVLYGLGRNPGFLAYCLDDDTRMKCLRFLMQIAPSNRREEFAQQLAEIDNREFWDTLAAVADMGWNLAVPQQKYASQFICRYLLKASATSFDTLQELVGLITPDVQEVFDPIKLVDHLVTLGGLDGVFAYLRKARSDFALILPKYKDVALWRVQSLSQDLLSAVAERYMSTPQDAYLPWLSICSSVEQFKAACRLADANFSSATLQAFVLDPINVSIINRLSEYRLDLGLLYDGHRFAVLRQIDEINNVHERDACFILFAQNQINAAEYVQFKASCRTYPQLAERVVALHKEGFSATELKQLAFDSTRHRTASFLSSLGLKYQFRDLTPLFCQTCLAAADLTKKYNANRIVKDYLTAILQPLMPFYGQAFSYEWRGILGEAKRLAGERLAKLASDPESEDLSALISESDAFFDGQMTLYSRALELEIDPQQLVMTNREHANEAARAIEQVYLATEEDNYADRRQQLSTQIIRGFARLPAEVRVDETKTRAAVDALISYDSRNYQEAAGLPFELLLTSQELPRVIPVLAAHGLSVLALLDEGNSLNKGILIALNNLTALAPNNKRAFELAMQEDEKGHDFRMLLTMIPLAEQPNLVSFLVSGIEAERVIPSRQIATDYMNSTRQLRHLALRLDESLVLVNRLRKLELGNEVIEFMVKNNQKSKYFCKAVARIEAESEAIMRRLQIDHQDKFTQLQRGPEQQYRKALYTAMYNALNANKSMSKEQLKAALEKGISDAQAHIEKIVEVDKHLWFRTALMVIANLALGVLSLLTVGVASVGFYNHYQKTGDILLFSRPASEESYRAMNKQTLDEVTAIIGTAPVGA